MKLLITGDWHITNKSPKRRTDDYFETLYKKLEFILDVAKNHKVEAILQPGDFFDSHKASDFLKQELILLLKNVDIKTIFGQHDLRFDCSNINFS